MRSVVVRTVTSQSEASLRARAVPPQRRRTSGSRSTSQSSAPRSSGVWKTSRRSSTPKTTLPMPMATSLVMVAPGLGLATDYTDGTDGVVGGLNDVLNFGGTAHFLIGLGCISIGPGDCVRRPGTFARGGERSIVGTRVGAAIMVGPSVCWASCGDVGGGVASEVMVRQDTCDLPEARSAVLPR